MTNLLDNFKHDLAEVSWRELRIHLQRDALILVAAELDLVTAAVAVAKDDTAQVQQWIATGLLGKPSAEQLQDWERESSRPFRMLIVKPFILIQDICHG